MGGGGEGEGSEPVTGPAGAAALATLHIRGTSGNKFAVQADLGATVGAFKAIVAESCDVPAPQ
jgi:ubiquilin